MIEDAYELSICYIHGAYMSHLGSCPRCSGNKNVDVMSIPLHNATQNAPERPQRDLSIASGVNRRSALEQAFMGHWRLLAKDCPPPQEEYVFHPVRKWRFDFAWPDYKIAVEMEGGLWMRGRHNQATGYINDLEKYNAAILLGWSVLRYHQSNVQVVEQVKSLIIQRLRGAA